MVQIKRHLWCFKPPKPGNSSHLLELLESVQFLIIDMIITTYALFVVILLHLVRLITTPGVAGDLRIKYRRSVRYNG